MAPEIVLGKEYDEKIDVWSLGIMLYEFIHGFDPFNFKSKVLSLT